MRARVGGRAGEAALARGAAAASPQREPGARIPPRLRGAERPIRGGSRRCMPINYERESERGRARERDKEGDSILSEINTEEIVTHIHHIPQTQCVISQGMLQRRQHIPAALQVAENG